MQSVAGYLLLKGTINYFIVFMTIIPRRDKSHLEEASVKYFFLSFPSLLTVNLTLAADMNVFFMSFGGFCGLRGRKE